MKTKLTTILSIFISIIIVYSCSKNSTEQEEQPEVTGQVLSRSECNSHIKTTLNSDADSNQSCIAYSYDAVNKRLNIIHENAGFNCCPGEVSCAISYVNDTITIEEIPELAMCGCECLFDLEIQVNGVLEKTYYLKFIEPYVGDQEKLEFMVNLQQQSSGEYCVVRYQYPWGI